MKDPVGILGFRRGFRWRDVDDDAAGAGQSNRQCLLVQYGRAASA
jgi:hypothetical protein